MTQPGADDLRAAMQATWPAAEEITVGPFVLRRSQGGGQRVTAATLAPGAEGLAEALPRAEAQMQGWGQRSIFQVTPETPGLDALLDAAGYAIKDPVILYVASLEDIAAIATPRLSTFALWPPLAVQREIWAAGGIGPDRVAVMERVQGAKTALLARRDDRPVGVGFAAIHNRIVILHALEVRPEDRRKGNARRLMSQAAQWGIKQGASHLALAVTEANIGARALYGDLGMVPAARYHYRIHP